MASLKTSFCVIVTLWLCQTIDALEPRTTACMDGWLPNNGSCYLFGHGNGMHFFEAQHYCEHFGSSLVHIEDIHENRFLMEFIRRLRTSNFWIGLTDEMVEGEWRWVDTDTSPGFTAWRPGQPNQGPEDCVAVESTYEWGDFNCDSNFFPLCELKGFTSEPEIIG